MDHGDDNIIVWSILWYRNGIESYNTLSSKYWMNPHGMFGIEEKDEGCRSVKRPSAVRRQGQDR